MKACDERSAELLEQAAKALGDSPAARSLIQSAYDLGRVDGGYEQVAAAVAKMESTSKVPS